MRTLELIVHIKDFSYIFGLNGTITPLINFKERIDLGNNLILNKISTTKIDLNKSDKSFSPNDEVKVNIPIDLSDLITITTVKSSGGVQYPLVPKVCPICGTPLIKGEHQHADRCINKSCRAQMVSNMILFTSAVGLQFTYPAKKTFEALLSRGTFATPVNLFKLTDEDFNTPEFTQLEAQAYQNYVHSIRGNTPLDKILLGLNIRGWSKDTCSKIKNYFTEHHLTLLDLDLLFDPKYQQEIKGVEWDGWNEVIALDRNKNMFMELMEILHI